MACPERPNGLPTAVPQRSARRVVRVPTEPGQLVCAALLAGAPDRCRLREELRRRSRFWSWMRYELYDLIAKIPPRQHRARRSSDAAAVIEREVPICQVRHVSGDLPGFVIDGRQASLRSFRLLRVANWHRPRLPQGPAATSVSGRLSSQSRRSKGTQWQQLADLLSREVRQSGGRPDWLGGPLPLFLCLVSCSSDGKRRALCAAARYGWPRSRSTRLKKQLGLRVESRKVPGDAVIVDSALKVPTGN
jgi:hypothetical protein